MDCTMLGLPVPPHLPEFAQVHVHCSVDASQASCVCVPIMKLILKSVQKIKENRIYKTFLERKNKVGRLWLISRLTIKLQQHDPVTEWCWWKVRHLGWWRKADKTWMTTTSERISGEKQRAEPDVWRGFSLPGCCWLSSHASKAEELTSVYIPVEFWGQSWSSWLGKNRGPHTHARISGGKWKG